MKDADIIRELLKRNKISREDVEAFLKEKNKDESILLYLVRKGVLSEGEALEFSQELLMSQEFTKTEGMFLDDGVLLEDRYIIYKVKDSTYAVPYSHIRTMELKGKNVVLYTGGIERITITLKDEESARTLFEEILLGIERLYVR